MSPIVLALLIIAACLALYNAVKTQSLTSVAVILIIVAIFIR